MTSGIRTPPSDRLVFEVTLDTGPVRVEVDPNVDLEPLTPDEFTAMMGFIRGAVEALEPESEDEHTVITATAAVLTHLTRALPDADPVELARALRNLL